MTKKAVKNWEYYGAHDPYYAVLTQNKFRSEKLDDTALKDFFLSGEEYVENIWKEIEVQFVPNFRPQKALDFGCGVGRLTMPLAKKCVSITGVDISENMLTEARRNCVANNITNAEFVQGDDTLSKIKGTFDFVHSFIVFQHIEPQIGEGIFRRLVESLNENGVGVLHVTYKDSVPGFTQLRLLAYRKMDWILKLRNFVLRARQEPLIPMMGYNLNNLFGILQENGCHRCSVRFTNHHFYGTVLFFQKKKQQLY